MGKGKKFNAAEKHFNEVSLKERQYKKMLELKVLELEKQRGQNEETILRLTAENATLSGWVERLLEYTELNKEDIKAACKKDTATASFFELMTALSSRFGMGI